MPERTAPVILLGVTGSIAAYKAVEIASLLTQRGVRVPVVLTRGAQEFIRPLSFEALTRQPVYTGLFDEHAVEPRHIGLAESAGVLLVAPATANSIAKLALGLADELLYAVALATRAPLVIAPAMNDGMFTHPATQGHLDTLRARGATVIGPEEGRLASGKTGRGRMSPPEAVANAALALLAGGGHVC